MFPDPVLTANIYCTGLLDHIIYDAIENFFRRLRELDTEKNYYLWTVRYGRCGDHLKVRLHGPEEHKAFLQAMLAESVASCFKNLPEPAAPSTQKRMEAPPVDVEDEADQDYPDRTLLWTRYRRKDISLARRPFYPDDRYAALATRCLGRACEIVLASLKPREPGGPVPHRLRQTTLIKSLILGLAGLEFSAAARSAYLAFHRDWLLRFALHKNNADATKSGEILDRFDERVDGLGDYRETLRKAAHKEWQGEGGAREELFTAWQGALADLLRYVEPCRDDPAYHVDPFASDPVFVPVFKVFHGLGNQLGLNMLDEAFAHHLLLRATSPAEAGEPVIAEEAKAS
jgi:hypothetical protein